MRELDAILDAWRHLNTSRQDAVLTTVVHVSGSAYRRPGARMLVTTDGARPGSVSGGCLEGEIARKAWWLTDGDAAAVVEAYDTTSDDDAAWEFGLGCNGVVHVMLERVRTQGTAELLDFLTAHRESGEPVVVATVIRTGPGTGVRVGDRMLLDGWVRRGALVGSPLEECVRAHGLEVLRCATSCLVHLEESEVFIEWIGPPLSLVVFGAGDDAVPVVAAAKLLGWQVTVADGRPAYARAARFPGADRVVAMSTRDLLGGIEIGRHTAVVLMTHNYPLDARLLPLVLMRQPRYLGMLGPRSRAENLFAALDQAMPSTVHAPVGLDIGGDTPAVTALSIVAEIQATTHQRCGGLLKHRIESIHPPVVEVGAQSPRQPEAPTRPAYCETVVGSHV